MAVVVLGVALVGVVVVVVEVGVMVGFSTMLDRSLGLGVAETPDSFEEVENRLMGGRGSESWDELMIRRGTGDGAEHVLGSS